MFGKVYLIKSISAVTNYNSSSCSKQNTKAQNQFCLQYKGIGYDLTTSYCVKLTFCSSQGVVLSSKGFFAKGFWWSDYVEFICNWLGIICSLAMLSDFQSQVISLLSMNSLTILFISGCQVQNQLVWNLVKS